MSKPHITLSVEQVQALALWAREQEDRMRGHARGSTFDAAMKVAEEIRDHWATCQECQGQDVEPEPTPQQAALKPTGWGHS